MARAAKKETPLTTEEKLAKALVPEEERPYPVPENWCWIYLKSISIIKTGKKDANYGVVNGQYYFFTCAAEPIRCNGYSFEGKYILLAGNGDIGNISLYDGKFEAYQRTYVLSIHPHYNTEYIYYNFLFRWVDYNANKMFGSAIPYVRLGNLQKFPIPLPPFPEQHRIVTLIESLFADLDAAKEKLQAVLDGFAERRAALLHQAFTGELTREWREEQGIDGEREVVTIASICHSLKYGTAKKSIPKGKVAVLRMGNMQNGEIDWTSLVYSDDEEDNQKYKLSPGDVLFNRTNSAEWVGKTSIYRGEIPAIYAGYLIKLDYDHKKIIGDYLNYILNSPVANEYCRRVKTDGVNQSNINAKKIGAFSFSLIPLPEQKEIVRILDDIFAKESQAKATVESALVEIDTMKKAILATAFRGGFGTNDNSDESAEELLRKVL